ncbi:ribosome-associated GTPase EngA [Candidatus Omnitrophus magneticus]|uniref:GTPase Der n=1 Tax=Candidatus Omnitrophus magneticus TaxID=1609969 RepID=A0A0F0CNT1_9BACT|nr:ribosome-associated GTPase EngA [Candidatus Omnitrophus magneticus]
MINIPVISIVGRPNVGKSSLFNQLVGERKAVVVKEAGTTRDRVSAEISIKEYHFHLVDTAGYHPDDKGKLALLMKEQIDNAISEAAILIMVVDAIAGLSPVDMEIVEALRKSSKPVILAVNKTDNKAFENNAVDFYRLGLGEPVMISCLHTKGIDKLKVRVTKVFAEQKDSFDKQIKSGADKYLKIAVIGRPNVGKSSFVNAILQKERVIVSDIPGTTRDSIDTFFTFEKGHYVIIDTAGIRHKRKIKTVADTFSILRSYDSIKRADVIVYMIDATSALTRDDMEILDFLEENGKPAIIAVNKWDLAMENSDVTIEGYQKELIKYYHRIEKYPFIFISAKNGKNLTKIFPILNQLNENLDLKIATPVLNKIMERNNPSLVPVGRNKQRPNFMYITQIKSRPIEFSIFVNHPDSVTESQTRFLENSLRANFPLEGIPIKLHIRKSNKR